MPHRRCGKIIVAEDEAQLSQVLAIKARAAANGRIGELQLLSRCELRALEPELEGVIGLLSPTTGIVDSHAFMLALQGDFEAAGGMIAFETPVEGGQALSDAIAISTGGKAPATITARHVVLAAGLSAPRLARSIVGVIASRSRRPISQKEVISAWRAVLPFPASSIQCLNPAASALVCAFDLAGRTRFGPDVEWLDVADERSIDYRVDPDRAVGFSEAIKRYWPGLKEDHLTPDYSGVRPKLVSRGETDADFVIQDETAHSVTGLIAVYRIEKSRFDSVAGDCITSGEKDSRTKSVDTFEPIQELVDSDGSVVIRQRPCFDLERPMWKPEDRIASPRGARLSNRTRRTYFGFARHSKAAQGGTCCHRS